MKICIVSSCGGHLTEVRCLLPAYAHYPHFYVLNDQALLSSDMSGRTYFITHAERDWRVLLNFWEALRILWKERPHVLLSTGAGPVVPFALLMKLMPGRRILFLEVVTRVDQPSLTARIMYRLANRFYYQWPDLGKHFPRGDCVGPLL